MQETCGVTVEVTGHVAEMRFSNPPVNFASEELLGEIADALGRIDDDPQVRCTLLTSQGKAFCAGADLKAGAAGASGDEGVQAIADFYRQAARIFRRRKIMIAVVQGAAVGAGLGLALAADFRIASPAARFAANFVRLGFHPGFAITHTLPRIVGAQRAAWMMLSGERVKGEQAYEWGLVDRLASAETLSEEAMAMAREVAENAPLALVDVRATLTRGLPENIDETLKFELSRQAVLRDTEDYAEGIASVYERRDAVFVGR